METLTCIRFSCPHCNKRFKAPDTAACRWTLCPTCGAKIQVPLAHVSRRVTAHERTEDRIRTSDARAEAAQPGSLARLQNPMRDVPVVSDVSTSVPAAPEEHAYPWETPQSILARAQTYRENGRLQAYSCKVEEFLEGLLRWQVFTSIKQKARQEANLAELHVYPDLVGIVERPPEAPGEVSRVLTAFLMLFLPVGIVCWVVSLVSSFIWLMIILGGAVVCLFFLVAQMGVLTTAVAAVAVVIAGMTIKRLYGYWCQRHMDYVAERIKADPRSPYAVKQMHKRAGWIRWRTGIGRGQTGAVMAERYWHRGQVAQLIRVDARRRLFKRNLLLVVMDRPLPADPGLNRIGLCLILRRAFCPGRRIYVIDFESGTAAADAAAQSASRVLDVPVNRGRFGWLALSLIDC